MAPPRAILLVDDHLYIRRMLTDRLSYARYDVTAAASAEDALCLFRKKPIDLVLTDLQLAGLSGFALTSALREAGGSGATVPILVMTANPLNDDDRQWRRTGATALIAKPFSLEHFVALTDRLFRHPGALVSARPAGSDDSR